GRLPNFDRLRKEGACGRLGSMLPTHSALIWTTALTGKGPEAHGINSHYLLQLSGMRRPNFLTEPWMGPFEDLLVGLRLLRVLPVTSNFRRCKALWNISSDAGLRVAALGWWASQPPEKVNGWIVSEFASTGQRKELADRGKARNYPTAETTYPAALLGEIEGLDRSPESVTREEIAQFLPVDEEVWEEFRAHAAFSRSRPLTVFRAPYLKDLFFAEAALKLDREHRPDLLLSYLRGIDVFGHLFWRFSEPEAVEIGEDPRLVERYRGCVDRSYEWADRMLGRYFERLGPRDTIVVLSDHGWSRRGPGQYGHGHAPPGILAVLGAHARAGAWVEGAQMLDVGPTILHLLGLPKGEDMPGRVLLEYLAGAGEPRTIPTWETSRSGTLEAIESPWAEEREAELRALGYVK
ncbi:MAG: alkaline phosphatase family protein, partial [Planctomycetota bacterium]